MDSKFFKIPLFHNAFLFRLAKTGHTAGVGGFSCIKSTISSVNHGCEIKMITVSP